MNSCKAETFIQSPRKEMLWTELCFINIYVEILIILWLCIVMEILGSDQN